MLLPALLVAASALAARADQDAGFDVLAAALRDDLRRNNDDYAEARRRSAHDEPAASFVPRSKYVRPIQNEFEYPGLLRRSVDKTKTEEVEGEVFRRGGDDLRKGAGSEGLKREDEIKGKKADIKEEEGEKTGDEGKKPEKLGVKNGEVGEKGSSSNKPEITPDASSISAEREMTPPRSTTRAAPRTTARRRPPAPDLASPAKKRYEVRTRTPADPQQQYFKNESESDEKFNSLSSVRAPETVVTAVRLLATTRRTMNQVVTSVRTTGVTVMRAAERGPARARGVPRHARGEGRGRARARARGKRRGAREAREQRKVRTARAARQAREVRSRDRRPLLRQGRSGAAGEGGERGERRGRARPVPRSQQLHVDHELKRLRADMRAGVTPPSQKMPPDQLLDMAPARGPRVHARRLRNRLCDRHFLRPEGPKYDSLGRIYLEKFAPRGRGNYGFDQTRPPRLVLPRCCNCCRKSVLGCE